METPLPVNPGGNVPPPAPPVRTLQKYDFRNIDETRVLDETDNRTGEEWKKILCKNCLNDITTEEHGIAVNGAHEHTCRNPRGIRFTIGCYDGVRGCFVAGVSTFEYTWFPGYSWSYVICANCQAHLGWYYRSRENGFFGLIVDQILKQ